MSRVGAPDAMREPRTGSSGLFGHRKEGTSVQALLISDRRRAARRRGSCSSSSSSRASSRSARPRSGSSPSASAGKLGDGQRDRLQRRGRLPGRAADAGPALQALAGLPVEKYPWVQVPAGEIGLVIAQVGAPLPIGAKSARLQSRVRRLRQRRGVPRRRRPEGRAAPGAAAGHAGADPPGRASSSSPSSEVYGKPVSTDLVDAFTPTACSAGELRAHAGAPEGRR